MSEDKCESAKRTLIGAELSLKEKAEQLNGLAKLSENLLQKFERTERKSDQSPNPPVEERIEQPDLIGLFEETAGEMQLQIDRIGISLEKTLNLID